MRAEIREKVAAAVAPLQVQFASMSSQPDVGTISGQVIDRLMSGTIDLPKIIVMPKGEVTIGFHDFDPDVSGINLQPVSQGILIQHLGTNARERITGSGEPIREERLEDYLVRGLIDFDDINYDERADLLYKLSGQIVNHLRSYPREEDDIHNVLRYNRQKPVNLIHAEMLKHRWERATDYEATVNRGFEVPKALAFDEIRGEPVRNFRSPSRRSRTSPSSSSAGAAGASTPRKSLARTPSVGPRSFWKTSLMTT